MAASRLIELLIEKMRWENGAAFVVGRCIKDVIKVGDVFDRIYRYLPVPIDEEYPDHRVPVDQVGVQLRVESIQIFSHVVEYVYPNYSAEIKLSGVGVDLLKEWYYLGASVME